MARRDMGKLVFLDLVDRSGRIQLICPDRADGRARPSSRRHRRRDRLAGPVAPRRAVAAGGRARGAGADPRAAARHVPRHRGRRASLPQALSRPADERGVARRRDQARADGLGDPRATSTARASSRSRRRSCSRATAAASPSRSSRTPSCSTPSSTSASPTSSTSSGSSSAGSRRSTSSRRTSATRATRTSTRRSSRRSSGTRRTPTTRTRPRG